MLASWCVRVRRGDTTTVTSGEELRVTCGEEKESCGAGAAVLMVLAACVCGDSVAYREGKGKKIALARWTSVVRWCTGVMDWCSVYWLGLGSTVGLGLGLRTEGYKAIWAAPILTVSL
jgi:hypothetical protein